MKRICCYIFIVIIIMGNACHKKVTEPESGSNQEIIDFPKIDRRPAPVNYGRDQMATIPIYDPESTDYWQMDLRCYDLSSLDLRNSLDDLMYASFDDRTVWPPSDRMPAHFDWRQIMDHGVNPGLGVQILHQRGITGRHVGIAIIDQPLLIEHAEYYENLRFYEEIEIDDESVATMHGGAVASIAVGQTVGVAPAADLYYMTVKLSEKIYGEFIYDFQYLARAVRRIIEVNDQLPEDRKIRVITMQIGWGSNQNGFAEITAAVQDAIDAGLLVISSSIDDSHGFTFHGLGRNPLANPNVFESFEPGMWWASGFFSDYHNEWYQGRLMVPMDSRTTASPTGVDEYVFYRQGGWSWAMPYIAGMYALAAQAQPDITPDDFWSTALQTGRTVTLTHQGESIQFGPILDPVALIDAL